MKAREKRDFLRLDLEGDVRIKTVNGVPQEIKGLLRNLSYKGLSVYTKGKIELGSIVDVEIDSPLLDQRLSCKGKVAYLKEPAGHGVFFKVGIAFIEADKDLVTHLIKRHEFKVSAEDQKRRKERPLDFMPY